MFELVVDLAAAFNGAGDLLAEEVAVAPAGAVDDFVDFDALLQGYQAGVDWPVCHFYRELAEVYTDAKVVLTVRDPLAWYNSISNTTLRIIRQNMANDPDGQNLGTELVVKAALQG